MVFENIKSAFNSLLGNEAVTVGDFGNIRIWMPAFVNEVNQNTELLERKARLLNILLSRFTIPKNPRARFVDNITERLERQQDSLLRAIKDGESESRIQGIREDIAGTQRLIEESTPFGGFS